MASSPLLIGLFFPPTVGYFGDVVMGVQEFVKGGAKWVLEVYPSFEIAVASTTSWAPDGILVSNTDGDWLGLINRLNVPTVQIGGPVMAGVPRVTTDNLAIGRIAATHFLESGFRHFAFAGYRGTDWSDERLLGYRQQLRQSGYDAASFEADHGELVARAVTGPITRWLAELPKPVALFAAHDRAAMLCANACTFLQTRVPEDIAILGVDNSLLECGFATPELSSIMGSARRVGYEGAELLHRLMGGTVAAPTREIKVKPGGIAVRQSTDVLAIDDHDLVAAIRFIRRRSSAPIEVGDVAEAVMISRRLLERKFATLLGRTPRNEILRTRLANAKTLLVSTDLQAIDVALQSGFPSASKFSAVFRRETGISPIEFRRLYGTHVRSAAKPTRL
jgi:LacI family transcriptional regulator